MHQPKRSNEGEAAAERISIDSEEIARVLTSLDATNVLAGETNVPTGSGSIPTAGPHATIVFTANEVGPTASPTHSSRNISKGPVFPLSNAILLRGSWYNEFPFNSLHSTELIEASDIGHKNGTSLILGIQEKYPSEPTVIICDN
nr:hypothetical protein [Tanacetum cinerariifolium]